jgi:hypothetical protein
MGNDAASLIVHASKNDRGKDITATVSVKEAGSSFDKSEYYYGNVVEYEPGQFRAEFYDLPPGRYRVYIEGSNRVGSTADVRSGRTAYIDWR